MVFRETPLIRLVFSPFDSMGEGSGATDTQTREEALKAQIEHMLEMQKKYPEADLQLSSEWWAPSTNLAFDVKDRLGEETTAKLNASIQKIFDQKFAPDAIDAAFADARKYLAGHEDLLERFDAVFKNMTSEKWVVYGKAMAK